MYDIRTTTLRRPQHLLDFPRAAAWTLALIGTSTLRLAHALDTAAENHARRAEGSQRPRARLGPAEQFDVRHRPTDGWRAR